MKFNPMTECQHLVTIAGEEATEISQAVDKALRFGLDDVNPKTGYTNLQEIIVEYHQLREVMEMFFDSIKGYTAYQQFCTIGNLKKIQVEKRNKTLEMMEYSRKIGLLE